MTDPQIAAFLDDLRQALAHVRHGERRRALGEARDHLACAADELEAEGLERGEAARRAVAAFGRPAVIAQSYPPPARWRVPTLAATGLLVSALALAALFLTPSGHLGGAVPASAASASDFTSISFLDARDAWALVARPCSGSSGPCIGVEGTRDGGATWTPLASIPAGTEEGLSRVSAQAGVAFGPATFLSKDGGRLWAPQPKMHIESATSIAGALYAITYSHTGCPAECDVALRRANLGSSQFTRIGEFRDPTQGFGDALAGAGQNLYAVGFGHPAGGAETAYARLAISRDAGFSWTLRGDPCRVPGGQGAHEVDAAQIVAAGRYMALLCEARGSGAASIVLSSNAGRTFTRLHPPVTDGNEIALDAAGDLAIANALLSGGRAYGARLAVSYDRGATWKTVYRRHAAVPAKQPPTALQIFGRSLRWAVNGQTLLRSDDAGRTWQSTSAS